MGRTSASNHGQPREGAGVGVTIREGCLVGFVREESFLDGVCSEGFLLLLEGMLESAELLVWERHKEADSMEFSIQLVHSDGSGGSSSLEAAHDLRDTSSEVEKGLSLAKLDVGELLEDLVAGGDLLGREFRL